MAAEVDDLTEGLSGDLERGRGPCLRPLGAVR